MEIVRLPRIKGEKYITSFCVDDCLATVANHYGIDLLWAYFDSLNIGYFSKPDNRTYDNLHIMESSVEHMRNYCGINVACVKFTENIRENLIYKIQKKIVIIISMDAYHCPWDPSFGKANCIRKNYHNFIIEKYDRKRKMFIGVDPYYKHDYIEIEDTQLIKGYNWHREVYKTKECELPE